MGRHDENERHLKRAGEKSETITKFFKPTQSDETKTNAESASTSHQTSTKTDVEKPDLDQEPLKPGK